MLLRHVQHDDLAALREGFEHLSPLSRYHRFNGVVRALSDDMLHFFVGADGTDHVAIVATSIPVAGAVPRGLGVARFIRDGHTSASAEFAITVADEMKHEGLGGILANALVRAARERGILHFRGIIAHDNRPIHLLLAELGPLNEDMEGPDSLFDVALASPASVRGSGASLAMVPGHALPTPNHDSRSSSE